MLLLYSCWNHFQVLTCEIISYLTQLSPASLLKMWQVHFEKALINTYHIYNYLEFADNLSARFGDIATDRWRQCRVPWISTQWSLIQKLLGIFLVFLYIWEMLRKYILVPLGYHLTIWLVDTLLLSPVQKKRCLSLPWKCRILFNKMKVLKMLPWTANLCDARRKEGKQRLVLQVSSSSRSLWSSEEGLHLVKQKQWELLLWLPGSGTPSHYKSASGTIP